MERIQLERLLADAFSQVDPEIEVQVEGLGTLPGTFKATVQHVPTDVVWLPVGWPRQVRELLGRPDKPGLVAATELSPGARALLTDAEVSWVDATGAARISLPGLYIRVDTGRSARRPRPNRGWTAATLAVCEGLLVGHGGTVSDLEKATTLAPSTIAIALRVLQQEHLLEAAAKRGRNSRRTIVDESQLLDAYAEAAARLRRPEAVRVGVLWRDPVGGASELGSRLAANGIRWSTTGALAAEMLAPYLTEVDPLELYADASSLAELRQVAREVGLAEASGGRLLLRPFPTPARDALDQQLGQLRLACWPRVFADLRMVGVRGEEAAEHLRQRMEVAA